MLSKAEYKGQVPGLLYLIDFARKRGIEVICKMEDSWRGILERQSVDWGNLKSIDCLYGSYGTVNLLGKSQTKATE